MGIAIKKPNFIVGCARSGTTILSKWFHHHPDVANLSEANDIWDPTGYPWASSTNGRSSPPIWINPEAHTARWWQDNASRQTTIRAVFGVYQTLKYAKVFLNKSPLNTFRIPYLLTIFPNARFVHLVRDGRAVAHSYAKKQRHDMKKDLHIYRELGYDFPIEELALKLAQRTIDEVAMCDEQFGLTSSGRLLEIKYVDFCTQTDLVLDKLCKYIGIQKSRFDTFSQSIQMVNQNHKWRTEFSNVLIQEIQNRQYSGLVRWGYL